MFWSWLLIGNHWLCHVLSERSRRKTPARPGPARPARPGRRKTRAIQESARRGGTPYARSGALAGSRDALRAAGRLGSTGLQAMWPSDGRHRWHSGVPILVQLHALTAIQQLQRYAIVFRNVLASNQRAVVEEATYTPLISYKNFMWTKKQPDIFSGVLGRSSRLPYAQQRLGSSLQTVEHQVVATKSLQSWPLRPVHKDAPMDVIYHSEIGTPHTMIEVMHHIKVLLKNEKT